MSCRYWRQPGRRLAQITKRRADGEGRRSGVVCRMRVRVGTDRCRATARRSLAALMPRGRFVMALMRGAGTVILVSRTRGRRAIWRGSGGTRAKAVYQEREYRDDWDLDTTLHQNGNSRPIPLFRLRSAQSSFSRVLKKGLSLKIRL